MITPFFFGFSNLDILTFSPKTQRRWYQNNPIDINDCCINISNKIFSIGKISFFINYFIFHTNLIAIREKIINISFAFLENLQIVFSILQSEMLCIHINYHHLWYHVDHTVGCCKIKVTTSIIVCIACIAIVTNLPSQYIKIIAINTNKCI